jgi:hypothetical protein
MVGGSTELTTENTECTEREEINHRVHREHRVFKNKKSRISKNLVFPHYLIDLSTGQLVNFSPTNLYPPLVPILPDQLVALSTNFYSLLSNLCPYPK